MRLARRFGQLTQWALLALICTVCAVQMTHSANLLPGWHPGQTWFFAAGATLLGLLYDRFDGFIGWVLRQLHAKARGCNDCQRTEQGRAHVH